MLGRKQSEFFFFPKVVPTLEFASMFPFCSFETFEMQA